MDIRPGDAGAGAVVEQVGGEERELRLGRTRLQGALWIRGHILASSGPIGRAEIELVITHRERGVAHCVVGVDYNSPFAEIGLYAALERVAGIEQQDCSAVGRARGAQIVDVTGEESNPSPAATLHEITVQIAGADDGDSQCRVGLREEGPAEAEAGGGPAGRRCRQCREHGAHERQTGARGECGTNWS